VGAQIFVGLAKIYTANQTGCPVLPISLYTSPKLM